MFFFNLLVAVFIGQLLAPFHGFHGFLCEFGNVHTQSLLYLPIYKADIVLSVLLEL